MDGITERQSERTKNGNRFKHENWCDLLNQLVSWKLFIPEYFLSIFFFFFCPGFCQFKVYSFIPGTFQTI